MKKSTCIFPKFPYRILRGRDTLKKGDLFNERYPSDSSIDYWEPISISIGLKVKKFNSKFKYILIRPFIKEYLGEGTKFYIKGKNLVGGNIRIIKKQITYYAVNELGIRTSSYVDTPEDVVNTYKSYKGDFSFKKFIK